MQLSLIHYCKTIMILVITIENIQTLMIEIYKIKNNLNPTIMDNMFERKITRTILGIFKSLRQKEKEL